MLGLFAALSATSPSASAAQPVNHCAPGQSPRYVFGFADLRADIGAAMGDPLTCEFPDPNGTGDVHQRTTAGLAFWRKSTNTSTFTDGWDHWALTSRGLVTWTGSSIDPPPQPLAGLDPLAEYPNPARVPPEGLQPFASLPLVDIEWPSGDVHTGITGYSLGFGEGPEAAWVQGYPGPRLYELTRYPDFTPCAESATYCPLRGPASQVQTGELFRGFTVHGGPAVVSHTTNSWAVTWYEPPAGMSYEMGFYGNTAQALGATLGAENVVEARRIVAIVEQFVEMPRNTQMPPFPAPTPYVEQQP